MKPGSGFLDKLRDLVPGTQREPKLVNLGCGGHFHPDWINLDFAAGAPGVIQHDLRTRLPFRDGACQVVYHSHVLEHLPRDYAPVFLKECHRVLIPGGIVRVAVPDLETIARLYLQCLEAALTGDERARQRYDWISLELMDQMARDRSGGEMLKYWRQNPMPAEDFVIERMGQEVKGVLEEIRRQPEAGSPAPSVPPAKAAVPDFPEIGRFRESGEVHRWMYDRFSLGRLLNNAGFAEATVCAANESRIVNFNSYCLDINPDGSVRKPDSLFMEAIKPAH